MPTSDATKCQTRSPARRAHRRSSGFIVLILVVNVLTHGNFFTAGNLTNVLRQITYNAILAVGQTFVIITAGIDLSVGSLIQLTGVVMAQFANASGLGGPLLVIVTTLVGIAVGCCAGLVNALPVVRLNLPPFITTLAMMLMARGLAFKLSHGQPVPLHTDAFNALGTQYALHDLLAPLGNARNSLGGARDADGRDRVRDRLDAHALRALRARARRQRRSGPVGRHQRALGQDVRLRDLGWLRGPGRHALDGALFVGFARRPASAASCNRSRPWSSAAPH